MKRYISKNKPKAVSEINDEIICVLDKMDTMDTLKCVYKT